MKKVLRLLSQKFQLGFEKCILWVQCSARSKIVPRENLRRSTEKSWTINGFFWRDVESSAPLSKLHSTCPEERFEEWYFLWKVFIEIEQGISSLMVEKFRDTCRNWIRRTGGRIWAENSLKKFLFHHFQKLGNCYRSFGESSLTELSEPLITFPEDHFEKKFCLFWTFSDQYFLVKKLQHCCQNCVLNVQIKIPRKKSSILMAFSDFLQKLQKKSQTFGAGLWKMFFTCPEELSSVFKFSKT